MIELPPRLSSGNHNSTDIACGFCTRHISYQNAVHEFILVDYLAIVNKHWCHYCWEKDMRPGYKLRFSGDTIYSMVFSMVASRAETLYEHQHRACPNLRELICLEVMLQHVADIQQGKYK